MTGPDPIGRDMDAALATLLAPAERDSDRGFAMQVERAIDVEAALAGARRRFWRSFAFEALAIASLFAALWLLSSLPLFASLAGPAQWGLAPPLLLVLALWFGGTQRFRQV